MDFALSFLPPTDGRGGAPLRPGFEALRVHVDALLSGLSPLDAIQLRIAVTILSGCDPKTVHWSLPKHGHRIRYVLRSTFYSSVLTGVCMSLDLSWTRSTVHVLIITVALSIGKSAAAQDVTAENLRRLGLEAFD